MSSIAKGLFTLVDSTFYESLARYKPRDNEFRLTVQRRLPSSWTSTRRHIWYECAPPGTSLPSQGWKIHVSSAVGTANSLLDRVVTILAAYETGFKFCCDEYLLKLVSSKGWPISAAGKFITIYPRDEQQFTSLLQILHECSKEYSGPPVHSDRRYKNSSVLFYRYGSFLVSSSRSIAGEEQTVLVDPNGVEVADERLPFVKLPPWITDPTGGPSESDPTEVPQCLTERFAEVTVLSRSSCGCVFLCFDRHDSQRYIVKQALPFTNVRSSGEDAVTLLRKEYRILKSIQPTTVAPKALSFFVNGDASYLVEEFIGGGQSLRALSAARSIALTSRPSFAERARFWQFYRSMFSRVFSALDELHSRAIAYGDVSPNNILYDEGTGRVTIIDFEAAIKIGVDKDPCLATPGFVSPSRLEHWTPPSIAGDLYAFGALMVSFVVPITAMAGLNRHSLKAFLAAIARDYEMPADLAALANELLDEIQRPEQVRERSREVLTHADVGGRSQCHRKVDEGRCSQHELKMLVSGITSQIKAHIDLTRSDRLVPSDPKVYSTNGLGLAYGACGVIYTLHRTEGSIEPSLIEWLTRQGPAVFDGPPGLYIGRAGIAWTLLELGLHEQAREWLGRPAAELYREGHLDLFSGLAGWGLTQLKFFVTIGEHSFLDEANRIGQKLLLDCRQDDGSFSLPSSNGQRLVGFAHGASGISIFLLYLFILSGCEDYFTLGQALLWDELLLGTRTADQGLSWPVWGHQKGPAVPYLRYGTAGVGMAAVRYYRASKDQRYLGYLNSMLIDVDRKYAMSPGRFLGLAGMGEFLLDLQQVDALRQQSTAALERLLSGLRLFEVPTRHGTAYPGYELLRQTCDLATGSAGIALFVDRLRSGRAPDLLLDEVL